MEAYIGTTPTPCKTETADVASLLHARAIGNGHARVARNGENGRRRRVRHQIHHSHRRAAFKADTAVTLVDSGMDMAEAIERCDTNPAYFHAMKVLRESGNFALHKAVLDGPEPVLASAKRVENAAVAIMALQKCSGMERELVRLVTGMTSDPVTMLLNLGADQLVAMANTLGLDWCWDHLIAAAMPAKAATESNGSSE